MLKKPFDALICNRIWPEVEPGFGLIKVDKTVIAREI